MSGDLIGKTGSLPDWTRVWKSNHRSGPACQAVGHQAGPLLTINVLPAKNTT